MEILKGFEVINLKQPKGESVMTVTSNSLKFNGRKTHFIPNGVNRPQIREASLITDKFGLKKGSCQCHEPSCLIPICTKNSPSPCGNGEHKSYIIFSVYLTECT